MVWNPFKRQLHDTILDPEMKQEALTEPSEETIATLPPPPDKQTEQQRNVVEGREVKGFDLLDVAYTLQKKLSSMDKNTRNDDAVLADPDTGLLGVFDGLGGVANSYLASAMAVHELPQLYELELRQQAFKEDDAVMNSLAMRLRIRTDMDIAQLPLTEEETITHTEAASEERITRLTSDVVLARKASALLASIDQLGENAETINVQTTACVGFIHTTPDNKRFAVVANVGDSAAFIVRPDGTLQTLTQEDSYTNELLRTGAITRETLLKMKREPDKLFPVRLVDRTDTQYTALKYYEMMAALTHSIGNGDPQPSIAIADIEPGDTLLFCTDGVIDKFEQKPTATTTPENVVETSLETAELARAYLDGKTMLEQVNNLRGEAAMRYSYKSEDDIAIVAAHVKGDLSLDPKT
ncbi:MAG: protein phosphatase 2C domain-containing protein [Patescibacteria group bacterium]